MAQREAEDRTFLQTVALVIAVIVGIVLVINLIRLGLSNALDIIWLVLEVGVLLLVVAWVRGRETMRWIGYVIGTIVGVMILISVIDIGLGSFWDVLRLALLALILIIAVGVVRGGGSADTPDAQRSARR